MYQRKLLGILAGDRILTVAEVRADRGGGVARRAVEVPLPDGLADPQSCGRVLREHLRHHGITARTAVIGIPLSWTLSRMKEVPETDPVSLAGMLHLEAEEEFGIAIEDLVLDFLEVDRTDHALRLFLVAAPSSKIEALRATARAAGLRLVAILPAALAILRQCATEKTCACLTVSREHTEFLISGQTEPLLLRSIGRAPEPDSLRQWAQTVAAEVRRTLLLQPQVAGRGTQPEEIDLWDDIGLSDEALTALSTGAGIPVRIYRQDSDRETTGCAIPAAVAAAGWLPRRAIIDFTRSRLAVRRPSPARRLLVRAAVGRGTVSGKASSDRMVLDVLDSMKQQSQFSSVKLAYLRGGGASSKEVAFAISFAFQPATAPSAATSGATQGGER